MARATVDMVSERTSSPEGLYIQHKQENKRALPQKRPKREELIGQYDCVHHVDDSVRLEDVRESYG